MLSKTHTKYIQSLQYKKFRDELGLFIAEGPKVVMDLLNSRKFVCNELFGLEEWINENGKLPALPNDISITAVQDLGNSGQFADIALRKSINEGLINGPRMRCAGQGLSSEGGQMPDVIYKHRNIVNDEYRIILGITDAIQAVRENITQGADVIKIYSNNTPNVTALSVEEMQAIVKEAHRYGVRVTAHATDNKAIWCKEYAPCFCRTQKRC